MSQRAMAVIAFAVVLAACEPVTAPTSSTSDVLPPPDPIGSTTSTTSLPVDTTEFVPTSLDVFRGALPDGLDFRVTVTGGEGPWPVHVDGAFVVDLDGTKVPAAEVSYRHDGGQGSALTGTHLLLTSGGWTIAVDFYQEVFEALGADAESLIKASIDAVTKSGFPVLRLRDPFSWDYESAPPEVRYGSFVVRRFCFEYAVACDAIRSVQVVSADRLYPGLAPFAHQSVSITSVDSRSVLDPHYLDPGPLDRRLSADLIWTGEEMIVWGGKQARDGLTTLVDGAAFDPDTDEWRTIAPFPLQGPQATRAVWGDDEMIVVSHNGTFGYDPVSDSWRTIGNGLVPSEFNDRMVYLDGKVYLWVRTAEIHEFDLATREWKRFDVPNPRRSGTSPWDGVLRVLGDELVLVANSFDYCEGKRMWRLTGEVWEPLPEISLATPEVADCSAANQVATVAGRLVVWDDQDHPSGVFSDGSWSVLAPIPLGGAEGPAGPVFMDATQVLVPRWGQAAIFDANTETWTAVVLPGEGTDAEIIWTGTEFLAWTGTDAWRWAPDDGVLGR